MNQTSLSVPVIGYHRSALSQKFGIPRQPNLVDLPSVIELIAPYDAPEAFVGIEEFSHLWISWYSHHNYKNKPNQQNETKPFKNCHQTKNYPHKSQFKPKVRPPRLGGNDKLGVFATRSTYRPSQLGLSVVKLVKVEVVLGSVKLHISGADMIEGTPIIDIKPYIAYSDALSDAKSGFAATKPELKPVALTKAAEQQLNEAIIQSNNYITGADIELIKQLIAQDPRPAYRQKQSDRVFYMRYKTYDIGFQTQNEVDSDTENYIFKPSSPLEKLIIVSVTKVG